MTAKELAEVLGAQGLVRVGEGFRVAVIVEDAKISYGRARYLVRPVAGDGSPAWVDSARVEGVEK